MPDQMNPRRRSLLKTTIAGVGLLEFGLGGFAHAHSAGNASAARTRASTRVASFDIIRQVNAGTVQHRLRGSGTGQRTGRDPAARLAL